MKRLLLFLLSASIAFATNSPDGPVTQNTNTNAVDQNVTFGSGRTLTLGSGSTLVDSGATVPFPLLGSANIFSALQTMPALDLSGTAGLGFITLPSQSSAPTAWTSGIILIYSNASNKFAWIGADGYTRTLDGTLTASRTFTLPDASGNVVLDSATQTLTNKSIAAGQLTGTIAAAQMPALTGDVTTSAGAVATTVGKINGTSLASLATGLLKNTTGTGVPSIATAGTDYSTPSATETLTNKSIAATEVNSGTLPTAQLPALTGDVTSSAGSAATTLTETATNLANVRDGLSPRGGLAFYGFTTVQVSAALTGQSIGTSDFSVSTVFKMPTGSVSTNYTTLFYIASTQLTGPSVSPNGAGLMVYFYGANLVVGCGSGTGNFTVPYSMAAWYGKFVNLVITRTGGTIVVYFNGVPQTAGSSSSGGASPPSDFSGSITSTYVGIAGGAGAAPTTAPTYYVGIVSSFSIYNLVLSQAQVTEIYELGGAVPSRFQWAPNFNIISNLANDSAFTGGSTDWYANIAGSIVTLNSGSLTINSNSAAYGGAELSAGAFSAWAAGKAYKVTGTLSGLSNSGATPELVISDANGENATTQTSSNGTYSASITASGAGNYISWINAAGTGTWTGTISNVILVQQGAVLHWQMNDGVGYQFADQSSNKLAGVLNTAGGAAHLISVQRGILHFTTNTNGNQQILGQAALPSNVRIMSWTIDSSASVTVSLGNASAGTQFVSSASVASGLNDMTLSTRFDSTNNLWVNANSTATLQHTIEYETVY